jgi:hypothetical protein
MSKQGVASHDAEQDFYDPYQLIFIQSRAAVNYSIVDEYADLMTDGIVFDAVEGIQDGEGHVYIWDGFHRGEAAKKAGIQLRVKIRPGTRIDAEWLALSANQRHGLRRSPEDKRHIVRQALLHPYGEYTSVRYIAQHCGIDRRVVTKVRQEMEVAGEIPQVHERIVSAKRRTYIMKLHTPETNPRPKRVSGWLLDSFPVLDSWFCQLCHQPQEKFTIRYWIQLVGDKQAQGICTQCYQNRLKGVQELPENLIGNEPEIQDRLKATQAWLLRQRIALVHRRLSEYPLLQSHFLEQLQNPEWVQIKTLNDLDRAITKALIDYGIRFEPDQTWNGVPTAKCLNGCLESRALSKAIQQGKEEFMPNLDGSVSRFCPYLRVLPNYTQQFMPYPNGSTSLPVNKSDQLNLYPPETIASDGQAVKGESIQLVNDIDFYCVAPDVRISNSCFHQQEAIAQQAAVAALQQADLPAVLPQAIKEKKVAGEFIWLEPQLEGKPCSPKTCRYASEDPPGFVVVPQPSGKVQMICTHAECGKKAQEVLVDWEAEQRRLERERHQAALNRLRQVSVEKTIIAPPAKGVDVSTPGILETIESILIQAWDTAAMGHIVSGWQAAIRAQIADELGNIDPTSKEATQILRDHYPELAEKPNERNTSQLFALLREKIVPSEEQLGGWIACLALVRTWRDETKTLEQIEEAIQKISALTVRPTGLR